MKVKLLCDGGYTMHESCIGKVYDAEKVERDFYNNEGYAISGRALNVIGGRFHMFIDNSMVFFLPHEVEVISES